MLLSNDFQDEKDEFTGEYRCRFCGKWRDEGEDCPCLLNREENADEKIERMREKAKEGIKNGDGKKVRGLYKS